MLTEVQQAWVDALRSGEYRQGRGALRSERGFCCLGVACDLAVKAGIIPEGTPEPDPDGLDVPNTYRYGDPAVDTSLSVLPESVMAWLGMKTTEGHLPEASLAAYNDGGTSFERIADIIEAHADTLFEGDR